VSPKVLTIEAVAMASAAPAVRNKMSRPAFGGSMHFGNRQGIGRFGMGMKTAALSMSPMELCSWQEKSARHREGQGEFGGSARSTIRDRSAAGSRRFLH
jgi:hypothetical protein